MSSSIVYLDSNLAHAFQFHRVNGESSWKKTKEENLPESSFYEILAQELENTNELILVGPGKEKFSFRKWISLHKRQLGRNLIAVLSMDQLTDFKAQVFREKYFH